MTKSSVVTKFVRNSSVALLGAMIAGMAMANCAPADSDEGADVQNADVSGGHKKCSTSVAVPYARPKTNAELRIADAADHVVELTTIPNNGATISETRRIQADISRTVRRYFNGVGLSTDPNVKGAPNLDLLLSTMSPDGTHIYFGKSLTREGVVADVKAGVARINEFWQTPAINLTRRELLDGNDSSDRYGGTIYFFAKEVLNVPDGSGGIQEVEAWLLKKCEDELVVNEDSCTKKDLPLLFARCSAVDIFPDKNGDSALNEPVAAKNIAALLQKAGITADEFRAYPVSNPPFPR